MDDFQELVVLAKGGNHQAFAQIYDQFAPLVRSICFDETGCLQDSEDLCQEVFLQAYRKLGQLHDHSRLVAWLISIARNSCVDWLRTKKHRPKVGLEGIEPPDNLPESANDETRRLLDAMRQLPAKERTVLHLFYLAEQPASVARQAVGLSNSGFYKLLDRAKKRIVSILEKRKVIR